MRRAFRFGVCLLMAAAVVLTAAAPAGMGSVAEGAEEQKRYVVSHGMDIFIVTSAESDGEAVAAGCGYDTGEYIIETTEGDGYTWVELHDALDVSVICDGETVETRATGGNVGQLFEELGIEVGQEDIVTSDMQAQLQDGMTVRVLRVTYSEEYEDKAVAHGTKYVDNADLEKGTERTVSEGADGTKRIYYKVKLVDGVEESRDVDREEVIAEAQDTVIERGTKEKPAPKPEPKAEPKTTTKTTTKTDTSSTKSGDSGSSKNDSSKSSDTSGTKKTSTTNNKVTVGDGTITTASGETLTYSKTVSMKATAYTYTAGSVTSSGAPVQVGIVAAKPSTLPQGTRVYIVTDDGKYTYGPAVVGDTPGGDIIDLFYETLEECRQFGVRQATVYVLD